MVCEALVHMAVHVVCELWRVLCCVDANKVKIGASDGIERILVTMKQHLTSEDVQYEGCRALANLSFNGM